MFTRKLAFLLLIGAGSAVFAGPVPEGPRLGRPVDEAQIAARNLSIFPDGRGLPAGQGDAVAGKPIYERQCASCHGPGGVGGSAEELAGAQHGLTGPNPDKTIGTYWPYATTVFDFIRRSMPLNAPGSLDNDGLYAVTAYLLYRNGIIAENAEMNAATLPSVRMPNREGFVAIDAKR